MARRNHTYAIRRAVEGGGQVRAELVTVGESGEDSLKRIESAGDRDLRRAEGAWPPGDPLRRRHPELPRHQLRIGAQRWT